MFCAKGDTCVWSRKVDKSSTRSVEAKSRTGASIIMLHQCRSPKSTRIWVRWSKNDRAICCRSQLISCCFMKTSTKRSDDCCSQWTAHVPSSSTALRCAEHQSKHNCVLGVITVAAYGGCWTTWSYNVICCASQIINHCFIWWCRHCDWCALELLQRITKFRVQSAASGQQVSAAYALMVCASECCTRQGIRLWAPCTMSARAVNSMNVLVSTSSTQLGLHWFYALLQ